MNDVFLNCSHLSFTWGNPNRSQCNISGPALGNLALNIGRRINKIKGAWPHRSTKWQWDFTKYMVNPLHWRHNDHDGVSNHQPHGCLLNRLFRRRSKKTSKLRVTGLCVGNSPGPVNSPHKGPVTRKMSPFDDVIMPLFDTPNPTGWNCPLSAVRVWRHPSYHSSAVFLHILSMWDEVIKLMRLFAAYMYMCH